MRRADLPTGTVTFLFSDIEGSTRLVQDVGPDVFRVALEMHNDILRRAFSEHGGIERGTQGDSFAVIFRESPAAAAAAVEAQRGLSAARWPAGADLRVRIGLHTGVGAAGGDDYVGVDIHRAARIAGMAHGGQTILSEATRVLAARDLPAGAYIRDLGRHRLRDLVEPEHLFELAIDGVTPAFPALRAERAGNLSARLTTFIGRERELGELSGLLADRRLLTIIGPGGIGKTSVALELARQEAAAFEDGTWLVRLETTEDPGLIAPTIADTLAIRDAGGRSAAQLVIDHLADRRLLLVLDNLEQIPGAGPRVVELLNAAPGLRIVATSRAPLNVGAEQVYPLDPLPVGAGEHDLDATAIRLFVDRARRARPGYEPEPEERRLIGAICRRLDGLPLGIELTAAHIRVLPPRTILARLEQHLDLPHRGGDDLPERHRTLRDTVAWSHDLLDPPARTLFANLSVFVGGCRLEEADHVVGQSDDPRPDSLAEIATLIDHSLVMPRAGVDGPRFVMLDTIRAFAHERLTDSGDGEVVRRRHALAYLGLAESESAHLPGRAQALHLARLGDDHDNLRAAAAWAVQTGDAEVGLRLAAALWRFWQLRGHLAEAHEIMPALLGIPGADRDDALRMRAVEAHGGVAYWRGDMAAATLAYEDQIRIARLIGDRRAEADGWFNLAHTQWISSGTDAGRESMNRAAALYEDLGDERGLARVAWGRSQGGLIVGRTDVNWGVETLATLHDLRERFERIDDFLYAELCVGSLAWAHLGLGDLRAAAAWGSRSLRSSWASGDVATTTFELRAAAVIAAASDRWVEAATLIGAYEGHERRHAVRPPIVLEIVVARQDTLRLAREHLDPATFDTARETGRAMGNDAAVDYALRLMDALA